MDNERISKPLFNDLSQHLKPYHSKKASQDILLVAILPMAAIEFIPLTSTQETKRTSLLLSRKLILEMLKSRA